jgi:hypothetical protein
MGASADDSALSARAPADDAIDATPADEVIGAGGTGAAGFRAFSTGGAGAGAARAGGCFNSELAEASLPVAGAAAVETVCWDEAATAGLDGEIGAAGFLGFTSRACAAGSAWRVAGAEAGGAAATGWISSGATSSLFGAGTEVTLSAVAVRIASRSDTPA